MAAPKNIPWYCGWFWYFGLSFYFQLLSVQLGSWICPSTKHPHLDRPWLPGQYLSINLSVYQSICQSISWYNAHKLVTLGQSQSMVAIEQLLGHGQQMTDDDPVPLRSPPRSPQTSSTKEPLDFKVSSKSVSIMGPGHFQDPPPRIRHEKNQVERWYGGIYGGICSSEQCGFSSPQLTTVAWITHQLKQCTVCNWLRSICTSITCHRTIGRYRRNPSTSQPMGNEIHKLFETPLTLIFDSGPQQMGGPQTLKEWSYPSERWLKGIPRLDIPVYPIISPYTLNIHPHHI